MDSIRKHSLNEKCWKDKLHLSKCVLVSLNSAGNFGDENAMYLAGQIGNVFLMKMQVDEIKDEVEAVVEPVINPVEFIKKEA